LLVALSLLGLYLGDAVVGLRLSYVEGAVNLRVLADLKERMFAHLQHLSHSYYTEARVGDVMVRLSQDIASIQEALAEFAGTALFMLLSAFAALGTLIYMNVWMGLLVLLAFPLMVVVYILLGTRAARLSYARQQEEGRVASIAQETLSAQGVVKAYGLEEHALGRYRARLAALVKVSLRMNLIVAALNAAVTFAFRFMTLLVIGVGGYLVITGHFTLGTLVAFLAVLPLIFSPITMVAVALQSLQTAAGSMVRVTELLDEQPAIVDAPDAVPMPPSRGDVALEHVTFGYDPDRPVLHDLDLTVPAGGNVAIVGPSGSGKSTVANLLLRFWDPQQGAVRYDGRDARDVTLESLRGQIGLVFQDTFVFDTTVRENIGLGRPGATDAEIRAAAEGARLDGWLATLPAGYDTLLGERGVRMSGGQRQRLAIARALLRDPRVLVLDEATSALDTRTEAAILESLAEAARGRTTITITHRLALAAAADRIFVLDQGRLVESGSHGELLASGGLYSRLHAEQTGGDGRLGLPLDRLRRIPLLAHLDDDRLATVSRQLVLERFGAGEIVARQGDEGERFYVVARGQVDVLLEHDGHVQRMSTLDEGDFFGEMALLGDGFRSATVRTAAASDIYSLSRQDLRALTEREPAIAAALSAAVAERRRALDDAVAAVGATPPRSGT
jgi:ABC-type multidrug transport system fused ATPase/permease subunit